MPPYSQGTRVLPRRAAQPHRLGPAVEAGSADEVCREHLQRKSAEEVRELLARRQHPLTRGALGRLSPSPKDMVARGEEIMYPDPAPTDPAPPTDSAYQSFSFCSVGESLGLVCAGVREC